jgi:phosphoribosylformylglycinamidine synthase
MGAAGLTCSAVEMGDKGNLGIKLNLNKVPIRETDMTAYEMMLSESQERMLMVIKPGSDTEAKEIFKKWDLDFSIIGETIAADKFLIFFDGELKADLPLKALSGNAPEYNRPWTATPKNITKVKLPNFNPLEGLKILVSSLNYCNKNWVWEQYDSEVMANTILSSGSSAGVIKIPDSEKAVAFTSDVTPRYVKANPREGGKQAVAEAFRNLTSVGAIPLAVTDNLNFGNPEKPEIMGQLVGSIKGISEAVKELDMPVVSGNVSLYNETDGNAILPTPTIGAIGLIKNFKNIINGTVKVGYKALLVGETIGEIGQSAILVEMFKKEEGDCPKVNLAQEKETGLFIREHTSLIEACSDLSDGGLIMAMFEMANNAKLGFKMSQQKNELLFGEDQGRYLIGVPEFKARKLINLANNQSIPIKIVGEFTNDIVQIGEHVTSIKELNSLYKNSFEANFN